MDYEHMEHSGLVKEFLSHKEIAVVGASRNPAKYGYIVYKRLKEVGYKVYPVNPLAHYIDGDQSYPDLQALPRSVRAAVVVVPPEISIEIARQAVETGYTHLWFQPGAESSSVIQYLQARGLKVIHGACLLIRVGA